MPEKEPETQSETAEEIIPKAPSDQKETVTIPGVEPDIKKPWTGPKNKMPTPTEKSQVPFDRG